MNELNKHTILIVDDDPLLRKAMVYDFLRNNFNVLSAENGTEAFKIVKEHKVDIIISDIRMPNGDGVELLENIRTHNPVIPTIILVTGFTTYTESECLEKGAQKFLIKPVDRTVLFNVVNQFLGLNSSKK